MCKISKTFRRRLPPHFLSSHRQKVIEVWFHPMCIKQIVLWVERSYNLIIPWHIFISLEVEVEPIRLDLCLVIHLFWTNPWPGVQCPCPIVIYQVRTFFNNIHSCRWVTPTIINSNILMEGLLRVSRANLSHNLSPKYDKQSPLRILTRFFQLLWFQVSSFWKLLNKVLKIFNFFHFLL